MTTGTIQQSLADHVHGLDTTYVQQSILCIYRIHNIVCINKIQTKDCMNDYPVRTEQQIALLIKAFRKAKGLTQADLANALGVTQQTASALERNPATTSVSRFMRTLSALGVELVLRERNPITTQAGVESQNVVGKVPTKTGKRSLSPRHDW